MTSESRLLHPLWLPLARFIAAIAFFLLGPTRVLGKYRQPGKGGLLVLANHISDLDPPLVQYASPRHIYFMAKSELFDMKIIGSILKAFGAFPVKRGEPDRESIRRAVELLKAGAVVGIFPEGQLSEDGELQPLKPGVAMIARMAACPVICCGVRGANKMLPYGSLIPRPAFGAARLTWGEPRSFEKGTSADEIMAWAEGQLRELTA